MPNRTSAEQAIDWPKVMETALTAPGRLTTNYNAFYQYSYLNQMLLLMQGVQEPVATYKRWQGLGRQVLKGSRAKEIVRPIMFEKKDDAGEVLERRTSFKLVKCLFGYSETEGPDIPVPEVPEWSLDRALEKLEIKRVPYTKLDANAAGYSFGRNIAVSPVDPHPLMTTFHELGHVVLGHTGESSISEYSTHRGLMEFQAESTAYLAGHELEVITEEEASDSRAYVQNWLHGQKPTGHYIRQVFRATDQILRAGYPAMEE